MTRKIDMLPRVKAFIEREHSHFIGGAWTRSVSGETFATLNPATGRELARVASADAGDVDHAVAAAQRAFPAWAAIVPAARERLLFAFADLVERNQEVLAQLESLDNGKPFATAFNVETNVALGQLRYFAGWPTKLTGETYPVSSPGYHVYSRREPLGVCAAITPWNYSLVMAMQKIGPALASGNTLVLKPAEQTPLTALFLAELAAEAGIPAGVLNVVTGFGKSAGRALVTHSDVAKVGFTGSTEVGREILAGAAGNFKRVSLELGGKSPLIIFPDADLDAAADAAFWGIFANSGQNCVAASRLYVHADAYDRVLEAVVARARTVRVRPGMEEGSELGPIISAEQLGRVQHYIEIGRSEGAELVSGGERLGGDLASGYFLQPTIFRDVDDTARIGSEEVFGPVLSVFRFRSEAEVLERANRTKFGLAAAVWTNDLSRAHRMAAALRSGVVWINTYDWFDPSVPFGGIGQSGQGRELGRQVMEMYTELKSVWVKIGVSGEERV